MHVPLCTYNAEPLGAVFTWMLVFWDASALCAARVLTVADKQLCHVFDVHAARMRCTCPPLSSCLSHLVLLRSQVVLLLSCDRPLAIEVYNTHLALLVLICTVLVIGREP